MDRTKLLKGYLKKKYAELKKAYEEKKLKGNIWGALPIFVMLVAIAVVMYIGQLLNVNLLMTLIQYKQKLIELNADSTVISSVDEAIQNTVTLNKTYGDVISFVSIVAVIVFIVQVFVPIVPQILAMFGGGGRRRGY